VFIYIYNRFDRRYYQSVSYFGLDTLKYTLLVSVTKLFIHLWTRKKKSYFFVHIYNLIIYELLYNTRRVYFLLIL